MRATYVYYNRLVAIVTADEGCGGEFIGRVVIKFKSHIKYVIYIYIVFCVLRGARAKREHYSEQYNLYVIYIDVCVCVCV